MGFNAVWRLHGPWRRPDLDRFAQTASFRELRSAAADWIDLQFADLEAEAAGLVRADRSVSDYGTIFGTSYRREIRLLANLRWCLGPAAWVRYQRQVAVAYGFDGGLPDQILDVVRILERAGWQPHLQTSRGGVDLTPIRSVPPGSGAALAPWEPPRGHGGGPPQLVLGRPGEPTTALCQASLIWATRGEPSRLTVDPVLPAHQQRAGGRTTGYQPLEFSGALLPAVVSEFAAAALERHRHAVAVLIELEYYENRTTSTRPHRLPRRLRPTFS
jgi:hypothetical protein